MRALAFTLALFVAGQCAALAPPRAYRVVAAEFDVPARVLYAIAIAETSPDPHKLAAPWPWTLNLDGTPAYFDSKRAAYEAMRRWLSAGVTNIDCGLMQVSWRWHRQLLQSPWACLDPWHSLRAGALILARQHQRVGDIIPAIGAYHAPNDPARAAAYRRRVAAILEAGS